MRWFKLFAEARNDAKLRILSDGEFRAWFNLLCLASEQKTPGIISGYSRFLLAIEVCSGDEAILETTLTKLVALQILALGEEGEINFLHFCERQYDKPSSAPDQVAERVRRHRDKKREDAGVTQRDEAEIEVDETPGNAVKRDVTPQKRGEEKRLEETPPNGGGGGSARADPPARQPPPTAAAPPQLLSDELKNSAEFRALQEVSGWWWGVKTARHDRELANSAGALRNKASPAATPENIALFGTLWAESGKTKPMPGQVVSEWENVFNRPQRKENHDRISNGVSTRASGAAYATPRQRAGDELDRVLAEQGIK